MATIRGDKISAVDLGDIVMLSGYSKNKETGVLTNADIRWQEDRRKRKVRKLDFEIK
tara:strand:- start:372 stop:542 length:171 start_codon:yes stop_codon:yes gene_type:complete